MNELSNNRSAVYMRKWKRKKQQQFQAGEVSPTHGLQTTYDNYRCRCTQCTRANQIRSAHRYERQRLHNPEKLTEHRHRHRNRTPAWSGANSRKRWTDDETRVATEKDHAGNYRRTSYDAALLLGRTIRAVELARERQLKNERTQPAPKGAAA